MTRRKKEVERLQTTELARSNIARPYIRFDQNRPSGKYVLEIDGLRKTYGDLTVIDGFSAGIMRGEKIGLMGRNAQGKTTMLKSLLANQPDYAEKGFLLDAGNAKWGHEVQIGYFPQDNTGVIEPGVTILDWLRRVRRFQIGGLSPTWCCCL